MSTIRNWHPAAEAFPMMEGEELQRFVEDIKANGVRKPIEIYDGERWIEYKGFGIDGRNRNAACLALGIEPPVRHLTDADLGASQSLTAYIVSVNVARRHLTSSQAALVGVEIKRQLEVEAAARLHDGQRRGRDTQKEHRSGKWSPQIIEETTGAESVASFRGAKGDTAARDRESAQQAAETVGTNRQYVYAAEKIEAEAPKLLAFIRAGTLTIPQACTALKQRDHAPEAFAALEEGRIGFAEYRAACQKKTPAPPALNIESAPVPDRQVPDELGPVFADVPKLLAFGRSLAQLLDEAKAWDNAPAASQMNTCSLFLRLQEALRIVAEGMPFDDCPRCMAAPEQVNDGLAHCPLCRNTKFITVKVHDRLMETIDKWEMEQGLPVPEASPCETPNVDCDENPPVAERPDYLASPCETPNVECDGTEGVVG